MVNRFFRFIIVFVLFFPGLAYAQEQLPSAIFKEVVLSIDTTVYFFTQNQILVNNEKHLAFQYRQEDEISEIKLYPHSFSSINNLFLHGSADYELMDSLVNVNNQYFRVKVKFKNLTKSRFLNLNIAVHDTLGNPPHTELIKLFPYTLTTAKFYPESEELFVGEEKIFDLVSNNPKNVKINTEWTRGGDMDYRVTENNGTLRLHILPNGLGRKILRVRLQTHKPYLDRHKKLVYQLPVIEKRFEVKGGRLKFLSLDKKEISLDEAAKLKGVEVMLDNNWAINLQKTYRIEDQEAPGGALIGEIYTRNTLTNNRVLCWLRVFNYHRISDGYLYIKDGDVPKFITNISITPKTAIRSISVLHEGSDWTNNLNVSPGETVNLKIEGEGLHKARFHFDDLIDITSDSSLRSEEASVYTLKVPVNIKRKKIGIYNRAINTGYSLTVKEFQRARSFEFITLNYGDVPRRVSTLFDGPIFYNHTLRDIVFNFNQNLIDSETKLYGKQYLDFDIRITNSRNELIDQRTVNVVVCPGDNSPRFAFYTDKECLSGDLSLNNFIGRKTYDLDDWSRILITIRHNKEKHGEDAVTKKIDLILRKKTRFDVDVSFPGGLLIKKAQEKGYADFGGISMAMIAQISFYHPEKIARYRPYKLGVGFLAMNAFSFSEKNTNRDVGAVFLASIYPTRRDVKLTFPLFLGGGYFLTQEKWFYLLGPGIRLQL